MESAWPGEPSLGRMGESTVRKEARRVPSGQLGGSWCLARCYVDANCDPREERDREGGQALQYWVLGNDYQGILQKGWERSPSRGTTARLSGVIRV
jgi:hypothetical protein